MFNKHAKTDEELLLEQAEFLENPKADRLVNTIKSSERPKRNNCKEQQAPARLAGPVGDFVVERVFIGNAASDNAEEPIFGESGLPPVPALGKTIEDPSLLRAAGRLESLSTARNQKPRSLFARQLLAAKKGVSVKVDDDPPKQPSTKAKPLPDPLQQLADTGPITIGRSKSLAANEIVRIHENNLNILAQLTEEEIEEEREAIIASADPKVISFLMHKTARNRGGGAGDAGVGPPSEGSGDDAAAKKEVEEATALLKSLGVSPTTKVPHMDVVEPEKLAWMQEVPRAAKPPADGVKVSTADDGETKAVSARFDLEGRVVPPDADVPMHLGLHHHGDEPERGGYTVAELFHLASSSQPGQRRLALSALAGALAASRRGYHACSLAVPSLLTSLLPPPTAHPTASGGGAGGGMKMTHQPAGVCFLLRWALDRCVSEASVAAKDGAGGGASIALVAECLRALANLLVDDPGEARLDEVADWSSTAEGMVMKANLAPSAMPRLPHKFRLFPPTEEGKAGAEAEGDEDHCVAMSADPVRCLFAQTSLAARLAWVLSVAGLRLPADTVAHALPALLGVAVRHSVDLALLVYKTRGLVASLVENFLPLEWKETAAGAVAGEKLSDAYGVYPLPRVLRLMRLLAQRSDTVRLGLVNDWRLAERCLVYLRASTATASKLEVLLKLEALRCLSVCLSGSQPPSKAVELTRASLDDLISAACAALGCESSGETTEEFLGCLSALRISWLAFFAKAVVPHLSQHLSATQLGRIHDFAKRAAELCSLDDLDEEKGVVRPSSAVVFICVTLHLLLALKIHDSIMDLRKRVFETRVCGRLVNHFIKYQSVLTGIPERTSHVDILRPDTTVSYTTSESGETIDSDVAFACSDEGDTLSLLTVSSSPPSLIDAGMRICLFYKGTLGAVSLEPQETGNDSNSVLTAFWPPSTHPDAPRDTVERVDAIPLCPTRLPSLLPLVEASIALLGQCDQPELLAWCERLKRMRSPPVVAMAMGKRAAKGEINEVALPHGLMAVETQLMARFILAKWGEALLDEKTREGLWWTAFHLVSCLAYGQESLLIELFQKVLFPIYDLTVIEKAPILENLDDCVKAPWPPAHDSFPKALAFYSHRVYLEYFTRFFLKPRGEHEAVYKPLKTRPSCDLLLPEDWFYMPLLEAYFRRQEPAAEAVNNANVDADAEVASTARLGWLAGLLWCQRKHLTAAGAAGHLARLCCALLADSTSCFNAAGVLMARLACLLAPRADLAALEEEAEALLPLNLLSLYDLFTELLEHYASVSFGSRVFANLLLVFLRPSKLPNPQFRRALWGEHQAALRALYIAPSEVFLPGGVCEELLEPVERDEEVLRCYASALCSGLVQPARQPLATLIAVHHLNRNIFCLWNSPVSLEKLLAQLFTSLRVLLARAKSGADGGGGAMAMAVERVVDRLRRYKQAAVAEKSERDAWDLISKLADPAYTAEKEEGKEEEEDEEEEEGWMVLYGKDEVPPSRVTRWKQLAGEL